jgi:hypothetical protein
MTEPLDLAPIEARLAALAGLPQPFCCPWRRDSGDLVVVDDGSGPVRVVAEVYGDTVTEMAALAEFIAAARADVPVLLAEVRRLRGGRASTVAEVFAEAARRVRDVMSRDSVTTLSAGHLVELADRFDRLADAALVLAGGGQGAR